MACQSHYEEAIEFLRVANEKSPTDPRPLYLLAYCQGNLKDKTAAGVTLRAACALEKTGAKFNWSQYMERVQGPMRSWMELERSRQLRAPARQ